MGKIMHTENVILWSSTAHIAVTQIALLLPILQIRRHGFDNKVSFKTTTTSQNKCNVGLGDITVNG